MNTLPGNYRQRAGFYAVVVAVLWWSLPAAFAADTDIYEVSSQQNCYILMDSSGSMDWGVYEYTIDYGAMYDYLIALNDAAPPQNTYIWDTVNNNGALYQNHKDRRKIYLLKGDVGVTVANQIAFTGDTSHPAITWDHGAIVDTHTMVDDAGNLAGDGVAAPRVTVDGSGHILFDGARLPLGMDIKLHDLVTLYNGAIVDNGFGGLANAPGFYFSGYEGVAAGSLNVAESGDQNIYFFVTGNWVNMQSVFNLTYTANPAGAAGVGDPAWKYEPYPLVATPVVWTTSAYNLDYPAGAGNYANNLDNTQTITSLTATQIQVHFSSFGVQGNGNAATFTRDWVTVADGGGAVAGQYDNDNPPTAGDGWSPVILGDTVQIRLKTNNSTTGSGYTIDQIRVVNQGNVSAEDSYLMQSRLDVAKEAMLFAVESFRATMNWGFATFGNNATGAQLGPFLNPTVTDDAHRSAIAQAVNNVSASGGTPLMEALEDVFEQGYYGRRNILDAMPCRKNYIISMTDGFPSADDDNGRIAGVTFADWDGDGWTQDPSQYVAPNPDYYDDVAHWLYTHSYADKTVVADPASSYLNVTTHHISFGANHPLLRDAAAESGGEFIAAYNKEQLLAAFYSLAMMMSQGVSFTAPVVSVDAVNKIQSGDDLYMGLFLPQDSTYWVGNLKKFKLGDGSAGRPNLWMIYDAANQEAVDSDGAFKDNTATFWGDDTDANDQDSHQSADIQEDGAGEVLLEDVVANFAAGTYWNRPIYTYKGGAITKFDRDHITAADLGVADAATRDKLVNFTYGYTYDAVAATGVPVATRPWVLGAIVHSRPVVVDYFNTAVATLPLLKRLVVVGSNDGMLHVFDDTPDGSGHSTGREVFAFIPEDILVKLKEVQANHQYDTVDGLATLYRRDKNPKYLIFGERKGGSNYWSLDVHDMNPLNWTVAWKYGNTENAEISQSWSEVKVASLPVGIAANGTRTYKDVAMFTGGYDPEEDNFPEPFADLDLSGSPYTAAGALDNNEWRSSDATQDLYNDNLYNKYNPEMNEFGRGIFVVDIDNPTTTTANPLIPAESILPFSARYGVATLASGNAQTFPAMKFCFPASPSIAVGTDAYTYRNADNNLVSATQGNALLSLYAVDIYANIFKARYNFETVNNGTIASPNWAVSEAGWVVKNVFAGNPGSVSGSGRKGMGVDAADQGRKAFYPPAISWGGADKYFDAGNYVFPEVQFGGRDKIASLFLGTGDREHPKYTMIRNRFYSIYDDSLVTAGAVAVASNPYSEDTLLNLTCDELGENTTVNSCYLGGLGGACSAGSANVDMKKYLKTLLTDNATYGTAPALALEGGAAHENDAKGWYIVLADQGKPSVCGHVSYTATISAASGSDRDNHDGEQVLSQASLYSGALYFTSYQSAGSDPCNPQGNGFSYCLDYATGSANCNLNPTNNTHLDITDRYSKYTNIYGIPSGYTIVTRYGEAAPMASMGGSLVDGSSGGGAGAPGGGNAGNANDDKGYTPYYWRDSNSFK